jgi:hypothetical protein
MELNSCLSDADHILPGQQVGPHLRLGTENKLDLMYVKLDQRENLNHMLLFCTPNLYTSASVLPTKYGS